MKSMVLAAALLWILATQVNATARLSLFADTNGYSCDIADPGLGGVATVYVVLRDDQSGVTGLRFASPIPVNSGFSYLDNASPYVVIGDPASGFDVGLGTCFDGSVTVIMEMHLLKNVAGDPCTFLRVTPHPGDSEALYADCEFAQHPLLYGAGAVLNSDGSCSKAPPPYDPGPPDGATGIPLLTALSWNFDDPDCGDISGKYGDLYFGTTPDPPFYSFEGDPPHPVGPLQPATTYYWQVRVRAFGSLPVSPVWSFTTTNSVAVHASTWGAIKALYR
jgi:hypothetical protein